jgi:PGF-pre-PGF domain-containing protein
LLKRLALWVSILSVIALILISVKNAPGTLEAEPRAPHVLYGQVRNAEGSPVGAGYTVHARINNVHYGQSVNPQNLSFNQSTETHDLSNQSNYGATSNFQVCADDPGTTQIEGGQGTDSSPVDSMSFYVNNMPATPVVNGVAVASVLFRVGGNTRVDLIIGSGNTSPTSSNFACTSAQDPTPAPSYVGGGGGGGGVAAPTAIPVLAVAMAIAPTPVPLTSTEIQGLGASEAAEALKDEAVEAIVLVLTDVTSDKVAEILELLTDDKAAAVIGEFEINKASAVVESLSVTKAASVIGKLTETKAIAIMEVLKIISAALIVEELTTERATAVIGGVTENKAAAIIEILSITKGANIIVALVASNIERATIIIDKITSGKAASILSEVDPISAGKVFDEIKTASATNIIRSMSEQKLIERLPEMTADKMFAIDPKVLFNSMPNVPVEQLVKEITPKIAAGTIVELVQSTDTESIYLVNKAVPGEWSALIAAQRRPIDIMLGKFNSDLNELSVRVEDLIRAPDGAPNLPKDEVLYEIFGVHVDGVEASDIAAVHTTAYIEKSWMSKYSIHKWSIRLNRLDPESNTWVSFESKRLYETDDRIYYSMVVPRFSSVSISGSETLPEKSFQLSQLSIRPVRPIVGEPVTISATVKNLTMFDMTYPANLWVDETISNSLYVQVPAGESTTFTFTMDNAQGKHDVRIDKLMGNFSIGFPSSPTPVEVTKAVPSVTVAVPIAISEPTSTPEPTAIPETIVSAPVSTEIPKPESTPPTAEPTKISVEATATPIVTLLESTATPVAQPTPEIREPPSEEEGGGNMGLIIAIVVVAVVVIGGGLGFMMMRNKS